MSPEQQNKSSLEAYLEDDNLTADTGKRLSFPEKPVFGISTTPHPSQIYRKPLVEVEFCDFVYIRFEFKTMLL